jgi:putative ABC transport system permease protein
MRLILTDAMVIAGRPPREDRAEEAAVDEELAERRSLRVGSTYPIETYTMAQFGPATAVVLSPLTPIGVDRPVLAVGGVAIILLVAVCAAWPAWRAARAPGTSLGVIDPAGPSRSSRLAGALTSVAARPSVVTGVRLALEPGRGRTAVPVRAAMAGAAAAVAAVTTAAVFAASLAHLGRTPSEPGSTDPRMRWLVS